MMIKSFIIALLLCTPLTHADELKQKAKKIEKRKGYCSPLDKVMGSKHCKDQDHSKGDKKAVDKIKEVDKKVKKRKDYCSPLDKLTNKEGCVGG